MNDHTYCPDCKAVRCKQLELTEENWHELREASKDHWGNYALYRNFPREKEDFKEEVDTLLPYYHGYKGRRISKLVPGDILVTNICLDGSIKARDIEDIEMLKYSSTVENGKDFYFLIELVERGSLYSVFMHICPKNTSMIDFDNLEEAIEVYDKITYVDDRTESKYGQFYRW